MAKSEKYQVVGRLPPGGGGKTSLAIVGGYGGFKRLVVMRPIGESTLVPVANIDPLLLAPLQIDDFDGSTYAIYDFHPGATLKEIVDVYRGQGQLPPLGLAVRLVVDAARVMHLAHDHQDALGGPGSFVHGALADSSLLLGFDGLTRVIDFGLRLENRFTSPEGVRGGPFDARSDVFALAAVLHAALTGFEGSYAKVLAKTPSSSEFPPPSAVHPDATPQLDSLVMKALFPARDSRLGSTLELAEDLERLIGQNLPQQAACATRLRQLFEERLDGLRNMVPRLESDVGPAKFRPSRPGMPAAELPPPRKSSAKLAAIVQKVKAEVAAPPSDTDDPDDSTQVFDETQVLTIDPKLLRAARPTGDNLPAQRLDKKQMKSTQPGTEVPWQESEPVVGKALDDAGALGVAGNDPTGENSAGAKKSRGSGSRPPVPAPKLSAPRSRPPEAVPELEAEPASYDEAEEVDPNAIEDVPTGAAKRFTGNFAAVASGSSEQERQAAVGQELVSTGDEAEYDDALDDLREQKTEVRLSGTHKKLENFAPEVINMKTVVRTTGSHPKVEPPMLEPGPDPTTNLLPKRAAADPDKDPATGVVKVRGSGSVESPEPGTDGGGKKRGGGAARKLIAFLLIAIAGGVGYLQVKKPALLKAKVTAMLVKFHLKKLPPAPPDSDAPVLLEDGGQAPAAAVIAAPDTSDAGDEEDADGGDDEDDDAGVVAGGDAGSAARDAGVAHKHTKHHPPPQHKPWWKTQ